ncbi:hypothetical protein [Lyngbya sp. PCC 8106]|uniref:hypothetical protein n=1 Tax=Lyngbya sp. (strain PCC 8106) TaxID=313612 RepID=UPI0000EA8F63|nr:hypothetical protein [Lyngbya sp. PCC 8106]EAW36194.1 hypothetical protein L8106_20078 [Lyngbya sp. PCC 8106]
METNQNPTQTLVQDRSTFENNIEECIKTAWLHLVAETVDTYTGDDWLSLCPDIDEGELYREWFVWYDGEVAQEWEAYDHLTDKRYAHPDLAMVKAFIDQVEDVRRDSTLVA